MGEVVPAFCKKTREKTIRDCINIIQLYLDFVLAERNCDSPDTCRDWDAGRALGASAVRMELYALLDEGSAYTFSTKRQKQLNSISAFVSELPGDSVLNFKEVLRILDDEQE
ncbi:hypothetical protein K1718_13190 [Roseibium porphyridii]|uniref:Uncharacterized protein n=1 Tax=Roseibium porphyridii TaxID=2866279 RepID=A0ABY8FCA5_9HYPH|nr:hypothetical protein [Roseibium sp. KMA01]WFE92274.1 hypothetical protein K1718_13190 [Roseibium sp. KMA01]